MSTPLEILKKKRAQSVSRIVDRGFLANKRVYVGMATCEIAAGSKDVMDIFEEEVKKGLTNIYLSKKGCAGRCNLEPMVEVIEPGKIPVKYCKVTKDKAREIVRRHLKSDEVIEEWTIR